MPVFDAIATPHAMPLAASLTSFSTTLGLATQTLPVPSAVPTWLPYAISIVGPALVMLLQRLLAGVAAKKRSLAESKLRRAQKLLADVDLANDKEAQRLEDEAAQDLATADALDAAKKP